MSLITMSIVFLFFGHVAWAMGILPGLDGFAQSAELAEQDKKIERVLDTQSEILTRIVAQSIEDARYRQCYILKEGGGDAAEGWARSLTASLEEYRNRTGREYQLRPCNEY